MTPEIYWVREVATGRLGIMPHPRCGEGLGEEVAGWCQVGVDAVVCLLESSEIRELELHHEPVLCRASEIEFISFPITDRGVPRSVRQTTELVERVVALLHGGASVVIHCRAGIGRSSLIAACVMLKLGFSRHEIFPVLSRARGLPVPDSPTQEEWLWVFSGN